MDKALHLTLKNELAEINRLSSALDNFAKSNNVPVNVRNKFNVALDEILTNTISYGYIDCDEHLISVNIVLNNDTLTAIIEDDAKTFNPLHIPEPDTALPVEDREIGGLGVHLVKKLMDLVQYDKAENKNILKIQINLK